MPHLMTLHGVAVRQGSLIRAYVWRHLHFNLSSKLFDRFLVGVLILDKVRDAGA